MQGTSKPARRARRCSCWRTAPCSAARRARASGEAYGEICFNTSLEGLPGGGHRPVVRRPDRHHDVSADRQLRREPPTTAQADEPALRGAGGARPVHGAFELAQRPRACPTTWREHGVVAIEGVDTRALVRHVRDHGAQRAVLSTVDAGRGRACSRRCARASPSSGRTWPPPCRATQRPRRGRRRPARKPRRSPSRLRPSPRFTRGRLRLRREAAPSCTTWCARAAS